LFSATVLFVEIGVLLKQKSHIQSQDDNFPVETFMLGYFYGPNEPNLIRYFLEPSMDASPCSLSTTLSMLYGVLPISLPVLLMVITSGIQVAFLFRRSSPRAGEREARERRGISYTIVCLTILFVLSSCGVIFSPLFKCTELFSEIQGNLTEEMKFFYCTGYLLFFLNSALNPVILVARGRRLQEFCRGCLRNFTSAPGVGSLRRAATAEEMIIRSSPVAVNGSSDNVRRS
jgi:membrane protease YdiL (CAAX protease family)